MAFSDSPSHATKLSEHLTRVAEYLGTSADTITITYQLQARLRLSVERVITDVSSIKAEELSMQVKAFHQEL